MSVEGRLAARVGSILSDGTPVRDLIDLDKHEVSTRVLYDPEIYRLELKKIFAKSWIQVAHESEIPNAGDFVTRTIGEDPVIVTRTADGEIAILLNVCAHRAMEVCRADAGNATSFKCAYHGWAYDGTGRLLGAPFGREMDGDWDKSKVGLPKARGANRPGMIFGSFGASTPPLDDYLGEVGWYLDQFFAETDLEDTGPPKESMLAANWKAAVEQTMGDAYHALTLHESATQLGFIPDQAADKDARRAGLDHVKIGTSEGHFLGGFDRSFSPLMDPTERGADYGLPADWSHVITALFPTLLVTGVAVPIEGGHTHQIMIGTFRPYGPGELVLSFNSVLSKTAPEGLAAQSGRMDGLIFGMIAVDDNEAYPSIQRAAGGVIGEAQTLKYNSFSGSNKPEGWPGPGTVYSGLSRDDTQWNFWLKWLECMTAED